jgi:serine/threonine protein kinase
MTDRYTLLSEIGRGGMGVVWNARDKETGSIVAIKLLRDIYAEDPDYVRRFEREAQLAQRIDSIHVVKVLDYGLRDKVPFLALEYIDGPSLHDALVDHGAYDWPETRALLAQLAQGLADANAAGVVHRDIKPSNVLIAPDGTAKLTDFGIARGLNFSRITATSTLVGTPAYLAPEGPKDARSDLYSLGIIGYELLTGAVPFRGTTYQEVIVAHIRETPDLSLLPEDARPVIGWLLAKDPAERPARASALLPVLYGAEQVPEAAASPVLLRQAPTPTVSPAPASPLPNSSPTLVAPTEVMAARTVVIPAAPPPQPPAAPPSYRPTWPTPAEKRGNSTPMLAALGGLALVLCVAVGVVASGAMQSRPSDPGTSAVSGATPSPIEMGLQAPAQDAAALPTLSPATPEGPQPTVVTVNRQVTDTSGVTITLTTMERLQSGEIRFTFDLKYKSKVRWLVNETEYMTLSNGAKILPLSWGVGSVTYMVGEAIWFEGAETIWELYPALPGPHPQFAVHTDERVFDGLTL